ncbi:HtaA domain-containing protein [Streptomyces sp. Tu102]|uniref:HtaA domain-containing protein n=1 Tax=Streptomyces sp. Tu102 TaxID=2838019 RepID=UPI001BDC2A4A|nr:HtaA domain-containing protein [Streptomyces sp. Tu102]MBT1091633.1 HtaA domain-containing protein [Streptomyces sp. Tu102]
MPINDRRRRPVVLAAAVATAATLGATALATLGAGTASAAEVPLSGYELTWGIKQSYRTYVTGMAAGTFTATDGASQAAGNGAFTFTDGSGTYDSTAHTVDLGFKGSVRIVSQAHGFDITLSDVRFDSAAAEITADVTKSGTTTQDVPLADVTVTRTMTDMTTKLTKEAADTLGSPGYEGAAGDPLTVVQKTTSPSPTPTPTATPTQSPSPTSTPTATATATESATPTAPATESASPSTSTAPSEAPARGDIADGTLGWGVKQSFRSYVVGGVANGAITTSGGASQAADNGVFTFTDATGEYDTDADTLSADFKGAVTFKGHKGQGEDGGYGLDLTLTGLRVTLDEGVGELTADVTSLGEKTEDVVLADLKADEPDLAAQEDVITADDVTATLTEAGAKAFGGFYTAGTELDPVDLAVALTADAELPDDGGTGGSTGGGSGSGGSTSGGSTGGSSGTAGSTTGGVTGGLASTGSDVPVAALGTAAAVTVAAGAGVVIAMRRRRTEA